MYVKRYFAALRDILERLEETQSQTIEKVADLAAERIAAGGVLHLLDNGHLMGAEFNFRAGGLAALSLVTAEDIKVPARVRAGDVIIIASVSGRSKTVVDSALLCKGRGLLTVAMTSLPQASIAPPEHPSGRLLRDVADYVIDIGGFPGDAMMEFDGLDKRACPSSGLACVAAMWALCAELIGKLLERGIVPTIYTSANVPGGFEKCQAEKEQFIRTGR